MTGRRRSAESGESSGVSKAPAADNVLRILAFMAAQRGPVAAATIARSLRIPRSSLYQLLSVLEERRYVVHMPEERRYGLGFGAIELSSGFARQAPLVHLGRPLIAQLVDRVGESAHLVALHGRDVVYIVEERAAHRPALVTGIGVRLPSPLTASGLALLSEMPVEQLRALFPDSGAFVDRTGRGPSSYRELRAALRDVTQRGFAVEDGEVTAGMASIGVAVVDHIGWPTAGIAVTFPKENIPEEAWPELAAQMNAVAVELARRIHGRATGEETPPPVA